MHHEWTSIARFPNGHRRVAGRLRLPAGVLGSGHRIFNGLDTRVEEHTWVLSLLDVKPGDRVLEIGFGPGTEIQRVAQLAKRGFVAGIDPSEVMLRQASRRNHAYIREGRVELRLASMSAIRYPDGSFDKVFGINCIQFSPDLLHDLGEIHRVVKPGGLAALAVQPFWKGATDATAVEIGRNLCDAMVEAGFQGCRTEQRRVWPRMIVCAIGHR